MAESVTLRSIERRDHAAIDAVLAGMDPEEAEEAGEALAADPGETVFSVAADATTDEAFGFLALAPAEGTESSAWLAWSCFLPDAPAERVSAALQTQAEEAGFAGVTRLFAAEGDTPGAPGGGPSRARLRAFEQAGFREAARVPGFYEPEEDAVFLEAVLAQENAMPRPADGRGVAVEGVHEHEETDDGWVLNWSPVQGPGSTPAELDKAAAKARKSGARLLVAAGPSNLPALDSLLLDAGFRRTGKLSDYHAPGVHEVHYLLSFA